MVQVKEQSYREKVEMYYELPKWKLVSMLIEANDIIEKFVGVSNDKDIEWAENIIENHTK